MKMLGLVGPTASGKTHIALALGARFGAEVVSVDSMQVYRGMDVATAKPSKSEQVRLPHHLIDLVEPGERFSVAEFQSHALQCLKDLESRGITPLLAGGSGLYLRAVIDELEFPPTDAVVRAKLDARPTEELWERLERVDPVAAAKMEPANHRRTVRALEVIELTGKTFSSFRKAWDAYPARGEKIVGLRLADEVLRPRLVSRTTAMFSGAIQSEVTRLCNVGRRSALETTAAIGYRQALALDEGVITRAEAIEQTVLASMQLARRQMRWFNRDPRIEWFDGADLERAARDIAAYWGGPPSGGE